MPLLIIVGMPCTGKSTRAKEIKSGLEEKYNKSCIIISENEIIKSKNMTVNNLYSNSHKEKEIRGILKSESLRLLSRDGVVIVDGSNYIKGYRYEIYCAVKNSKTTQVTVETLCGKEESWEWNERRGDEAYSRDVFEGLLARYEAPDSRNRWDSPLVGLRPADPAPLEAIHQLLFNTKPPPPNQSTQCAPLSSGDFLHDLDRVTQDIVKEILEAKSLGALSQVKLGEHTLEGCSALTPVLLARFRRQFLNYTKLHPPSSSQHTPQTMALLFIQFLQSNLTAIS